MSSNMFYQGFPDGLAVKNPPANTGDMGPIPGSGRSLGEGNGNPLQYLAWETPGTEEPGGVQFMGSHRVGHNLATKTTANISSNSTCCCI